MQWLLGLITGLPEFLKGILAYLNKRQDTAVVQNTNSKDVSVAVVQSETARQHDTLDVYKAMLSHPIFWCAWGLGVFPVMMYHAAIFFVSTFPMWGWVVLKVPPDQIEFSKTVVGNVFLLTGGSAIVAGLAQVWQKRS